MRGMARFAVFASGSGSNLQALIDACREGRVRGELALVVSDRPGCRAIGRAEEVGIPVFAFRPKEYPDKAAYERAIGDRLEADRVALVVLAGYMRILSPAFVERFSGRIVNIHPSLLPAFPGAHGIRDAWEAGVSETGVTVHLVDAGVDTGPAIEQVRVPVRPGESLEDLEVRIHAAEHEVYPRVVDRLLAEVARSRT